MADRTTNVRATQLAVEMELVSHGRGGFFGTGLPAWALATVLGISIGVFLIWNEPLWAAEPGTSHATRILVSYAIVVPLAAAALLLLRRFSFASLASATLVMWSAKLIVTVLGYYAVAPATATRYEPAAPWETRRRAASTDRYQPAASGFAPGDVRGTVTRDGAPVAGALVFVEKPAAGAAPAPPSAVRITVERAAYDQPSYLLGPGDRLEASSRDDELHTLHVYSGERSLKNSPLPGGVEPRSIALPGPGLYRLGCDKHPSESAVMLIVDHPYATRADADGRFAIAGVPAGSIELGAAIDAGEVARRDTDVRAGSTAEISFEL